MMRAYVAALGLALTPYAMAQQPDAFTLYMNTASAYERCVTAYAAKFAETPETPSDIASAAISACYKEILAFHVAVLGMGRLSSEFQDDQAILKRFEAGNRNSAIKTVLEKRYPAAK